MSSYLNIANSPIKRADAALPGKLDHLPEMLHSFPASYIEPEDHEAVAVAQQQMTAVELPTVTAACARDCRNLDRAAALWFGGAS